MGKSNIEWTDMVWNPVTGCTKISEGCQNCYAERMAMRFTGHFNVTLHPDRLNQPLHWRKPRRIFVCSMGDLFHEDVPDEFVDKVMAIMAIQDQLYPKHTFLVLTKRPARMKIYFDKLYSFNRAEDGNSYGRLLSEISKYAPDYVFGSYSCRENFLPFSNLWLGVTAENQEQADKRIPILLQIPAAKRFVSIEPLLGPVDLTRINVSQLPACNGYVANALDSRINSILDKPYKHLDWVIIGAESGPNRRECKIEWVRAILSQCRAVGIPVFIKQLHINGKLSKNMAEWPEDLRVREYPE